MEKQTERSGTPEIHVTVRYADKGPSLERCMAAILGARLAKGAEPRR